MRGQSRSTLFLMEQIIVIAVFAFCAAVCVYILVASHGMSVDAVDTKNALLVAESAAESFKAFSGEMEQVGSVLGNNYSYQNDVLTVFYDDSWQTTLATEASFVLTLEKVESTSSLSIAEAIIIRLHDESELIALPVAARRARQ